MKLFLLIVSGLGVVSCLLSALFHIIEGDITGGMTWILATGVNLIVFCIYIVAIKEERL